MSRSCGRLRTGISDKLSDDSDAASLGPQSENDLPQVCQHVDSSPSQHHQHDQFDILKKKNLFDIYLKNNFN